MPTVPKLLLSAKRLFNVMSLKKNSKVDFFFSYAGTKIKGSVPQTYFEIESKAVLQDLFFESVVLILQRRETYEEVKAVPQCRGHTDLLHLFFGLFSCFAHMEDTL